MQEVYYEIHEKDGQKCIELRTYGPKDDKSQVPSFVKFELGEDFYIASFSKEGFAAAQSWLEENKDKLKGKCSNVISDLKSITAGRKIAEELEILKWKRKNPQDPGLKEDKPFDVKDIQDITKELAKSDKNTKADDLSDQQVRKIIELTEQDPKSKKTRDYNQLKIKAVKENTGGVYTSALYFVYNMQGDLLYLIKVLKDSWREHDELQRLHIISQSEIARDFKALNDPYFPRLPLHQAFYKIGRNYIEVLTGVEGETFYSLLESQKNIPQSKERLLKAFRILGKNLATFHKRYYDKKKEETNVFGDFHMGNVMYDWEKMPNRVSVIDLESMVKSSPEQVNGEWKDVKKLARGNREIDYNKFLNHLEWLKNFKEDFSKNPTIIAKYKQDFDDMEKRNNQRKENKQKFLEKIEEMLKHEYKKDADSIAIEFLFSEDKENLISENIEKIKDRSKISEFNSLINSYGNLGSELYNSDALKKEKQEILEKITKQDAKDAYQNHPNLPSKIYFDAAQAFEEGYAEIFPWENK